MELPLSLVCNNNIIHNKALYEDIICYVCENISKITHVETHTVAVLFKEFFFFFFFCVPQLYLWGSPLLGEIFAYVTTF